jgi:hypothetical protein
MDVLRRYRLFTKKIIEELYVKFIIDPIEIRK